MFNLSKNQIKNFLSKFKVSDNCWIWDGATYSNGYGVFRVGKHLIPAHRVSYRLYKGQLEDKLVVMHSCDNVKCVNPQHLSLGTHKDNAADMKAKKRHRFGENHHNHKHSDEKILAIKKEYFQGNMSTVKLEKKYGIDSGYISKILRGIVWGHVNF